jgi:hypothetical protein
MKSHFAHEDLIMKHLSLAQANKTNGAYSKNSITYKTTPAITA